MIIVSRDEWNARPPRSTTPLTLSKVQRFVVHYSGAPRSQTVREIQNYCMDTKGHNDIDYNAIVKDGKHHIGRGWNIGGHTLDHNSTSYGVCVIGRDGDATPQDMACVREIYDMVCARVGRQITKTDHRMVLGRDYTDCPGDELDAWVAAGMPAMAMGDDMSWSENLTAGNNAGGGTYPAKDWLIGANWKAWEAWQNTEAIRAELTALRHVIEQLAAVIRAGGGTVDSQVILRGVDERLAAQLATIRAGTGDPGAGPGE
jgi:hypothetical protein